MKMKEKYFEGWYFKCATVDQTLAVIVGSTQGIEPVAFIQVLSSKDLKSYYVSYDIKSYFYRMEPFHIQIEENIFTSTYMKLHIKEENLILEGKIEFKSLTPLPRKLWKRGLMGPFAYLPFMECYHDIVSMQHTLQGEIHLNHTLYDFNGGKGYIERDWGTSFPSSYIWIQCNHFRREDLSFMLAIAKIPFLGMSFTGVLCTLSIKGKTRIFTTYTGASIQFFKDEPESLLITIRQGKELIHVKVDKKEGSVLKAPNKGAMLREIDEALGSTMELNIFYDHQLRVCEKGINVGFERVGKLEEL